jgi:uncharacterized membrane protein YobD (UPF0266 family)
MVTVKASPTIMLMLSANASVLAFLTYRSFDSNSSIMAGLYLLVFLALLYRIFEGTRIPFIQMTGAGIYFRPNWWSIVEYFPWQDISWIDKDPKNRGALVIETNEGLYRLLVGLAEKESVEKAVRFADGVLAH